MTGERCGVAMDLRRGLRRRSGWLVVGGRRLWGGIPCFWHRDLGRAEARAAAMRRWDQDARLLPLPINLKAGVESSRTSDPMVRDGDVCWCPARRRLVGREPVSDS